MLERSDPSLSPKFLVTVRTKRLSPAARTRTWQNALIPIRCILAFFKTSDFPAASPIFLHQRLIHTGPCMDLGPPAPLLQLKEKKHFPRRIRHRLIISCRASSLSTLCLSPHRHDYIHDICQNKSATTVFEAKQLRQKTAKFTPTVHEVT